MMKFPHEEGKSGMSLKKYEAFVRTVELGSLTKAAEAMGSTQSRISHVLSALEEEYGFVLLRRNRSGVRLTEAGEQMEGIALLVSSWGFAALVLLKQLGNCTVSRKSWLSYAAVFTAGLLLASLPFAAADPQFTAVDYGFVPADAVCCLLLWSAVDWGIGWIRKRVRSGSQANI